MRVSAKAEYACRAMLELSRCYKNTEVVQINDIALRQGIPRKYLVQILLQLQRAGLVKSKRGASGGYMLAKSPVEITLGDVMRTTDGLLLSIESLEPHTASRTVRVMPDGHEILREVWQDVQDQLSVIMDRITFEEICKRAEKHTAMYYI
jgi:Rrf2 family protein